MRNFVGLSLLTIMYGCASMSEAEFSARLKAETEKQKCIEGGGCIQIPRDTLMKLIEMAKANNHSGG